jgi:hypothetical protein
MLWLLSALLLVAWLCGMVGAAGAWIHLFLVVAILCVVAALIRPDRFDTV